MHSKKEQKEIITLLQGGNFTILYHDNGVCTLYDKKFKDYNAVNKYMDDDDEYIGKSYYFEYEEFGYCPEIVYLLTKALNGSVDSI